MAENFFLTPTRHMEAPTHELVLIRVGRKAQLSWEPNQDLEGRTQGLARSHSVFALASGRRHVLGAFCAASCRRIWDGEEQSCPVGRLRSVLQPVPASLPNTLNDRTQSNSRSSPRGRAGGQSQRMATFSGLRSPRSDGQRANYAKLKGGSPREGLACMMGHRAAMHARVVTLRHELCADFAQLTPYVVTFLTNPARLGHS